MKISHLHSDKTILAEIGQRIARRRLAQHLTQAELAEEAGIAKRTLERVEAGLTAQFTTIIRIFRVLGLLPELDHLLVEPSLRPLEAASHKGKARQRASHRRKTKRQKPWSWDKTE